MKYVRISFLQFNVGARGSRGIAPDQQLRWFCHPLLAYVDFMAGLVKSEGVEVRRMVVDQAVGCRVATELATCDIDSVLIGSRSILLGR